ncbi:thioredoxin family protein [Mucilaginibacter pedocola]|uniref:Thioredoxin n=1 Tax=Mucilaginibacter pedocola TaxID=1792845 RepID=A0A1S9PCR4_9SPHI|nr:thioredoxin domain-containing protein [Mucilaginibacter pedocola]OOQ58772.1 thiol reductase thioredoxin [Mucilaginibacter pedocola]
MALTITDDNFEELVLHANKPVLLDICAEWCGASNMVNPVIEQIYQEYQGKAIVAKLDADCNPITPKRYGVRNIPALLFFKNGEVVDKQIGAAPKAVVAALLDKQF